MAIPSTTTSHSTTTSPSTTTSTDHDPPRPASQPSYLWDGDADLGAEHLDLLEAVLDPHSIAQLEQLDLPAGARCLEAGAGNGSIARWLSGRQDPAVGPVLATDVDTAHIPPLSGVTVVQQDITDGVPDGPYDLIHARMLLTHLPDRDAVVANLVDALAPGGWLLLCDAVAPPSLATTLHPADEEAFRRFAHWAYEVVAPATGQDLSWGGRAHSVLERLGLVDVQADRFSFLTRGGDLASRLHLNLSRQAAEVLQRVGLSVDEFNRYQALLMSPDFRGWFYELACTRGRKPAQHSGF